MDILLYDHTFEGLITAVFEIYSGKKMTVKIIPEELYQSSGIFEKTEFVTTDLAKAGRVLSGIEKKCTRETCLKLFRCFLSEVDDKEYLITEYIKGIFNSKISIEENYTLSYVLRMEHINKQMRREIHRMHAFVRFQKTEDEIYFSGIEPDFNVLPLITDHFERRYADQKWLIYDLKRKYGYFYDLNSVAQVEMEINDEPSAGLIFNSDSEYYSTLWQHYFAATNIPERKNLKHHLRHVPKRYWKYLPEKQKFGY